MRPLVLSKTENTFTLLTHFLLILIIPLQTKSWRELTLHPSLTSRVMSCLRGELLQMESLLQPPKRAINIGKLGANTVHNSKTLIPTSPTSPNQKKPSSSQDLHQEQGPGLSASEIRLKFHQSSPRLSIGWTTKSHLQN